MTDTRPATTTAPTGIRIGDADRERAAERIRTAMAEGRLTLDEADERQAAAYAARWTADLTVLTADLPAPPPPPTPPLDAAARRRIGVHAALVAVVAVLLIGAWFASAAPFFWPAWPMFWLALSLFVHVRRARGRALRAART